MSEAASPTPSAPPVSDANASASTGVAGEGSVDTVMVILSYLGPLAFVPFFLRKHDSFVQFHAKQGLVLFFTWLILGFIVNILAGLGIPLIGLIGNIVVLALFILGVIALIKGLGGERWSIPVIGGLVS